MLGGRWRCGRTGLRCSFATCCSTFTSTTSISIITSFNLVTGFSPLSRESGFFGFFVDYVNVLIPWATPFPPKTAQLIASFSFAQDLEPQVQALQEGKVVEITAEPELKSRIHGFRKRVSSGPLKGFPATNRGSAMLRNTEVALMEPSCLKG